MLITDKIKFEKFKLNNRFWQGIPSIAITNKGRIFVSFYSGAKTEDLGNYCLLIRSDDDGKTWSEPIAVSYFGKKSRAYDSCVWIDTLGRLWFYYSVSPIQKVYASICDEPDADVLKWSEEVEIGGEVLLNKPTVLSNGEWWFPSSVWAKGLMEENAELKDIYRVLDERDIDRKAFCIATKDNGKTFEKRGGVSANERSFDEHQFLELSSGKVAMFIRTKYGIAVSYSVDGGYTWSEGVDSGIFSPNTRFFIRRLSGGKILLISHKKSDNLCTPNMRTKITAFISLDECKTWKELALLDDRENISYPDGCEHNGYVYVVYDRDRKGAGEIILAKFNVEFLESGKLDINSCFKKTIIKLK